MNKFVVKNQLHNELCLVQTYDDFKVNEKECDPTYYIDNSLSDHKLT